jgi:proline dehydrogenase
MNTVISDPLHKKSFSFNDTEHAFAYKSNAELLKAKWLFSVMGNPFLLSLGLRLTPLLVKIRFPFFNSLLRNTIFRQFVGGEDLSGTEGTVKKLAQYKVHSVLDYGVEGKEGDEAEYDKAADQFVSVIEYASSHDHIPFISIKMTGVMSNALLEKMDSLMRREVGSISERYRDAQENLSSDEKQHWQRAVDRIEKICLKGFDSNIGVWIDAEESWMQYPMDAVSLIMMEKFNQGKAIVFNTYQMYRHDRLAFLKDNHAQAREKNFILGAKLVRGAYMEKERARAAEKGYPSPIQPDKASSDCDYDEAVAFCIDHLSDISVVLGTHNEKSSMLGAELLRKNGLPPSHERIYFTQLLGMSDNITFNLASQGYNAGKYVPFGPIRDVIPYLMRRAQENSSVKGQTGRELGLINAELKRRKK